MLSGQHTGRTQAGLADAAPATLRPSEYTGLTLHALNGPGRRLVRGEVLEIGTGSGVVLAAMARLGAERLVGTDLEPLAIDVARALFDRLGLSAELLTGDLWEPVAGRRFDLIIANPPTFPALVPHYPGRLRSWSDGGTDGWRLFGPLLRGLRAHLAPGGRAVVQHSGLLGRAATEAVLAEQRLAARCLAATLIPLAPEKRSIVNPAVLAATEPEAILAIGEHLFIETQILEIGRVEDMAA